MLVEVIVKITDYSGWYCDFCGNELAWGEKVVVISGGVVDIEYDGPVVDNNPWCSVFHDRCYVEIF